MQAKKMKSRRRKTGKFRHNHVVAGHVASMSVPNHVERSLADTLVWRLSSVADVEAVFHSCDDRGVQHVYSIVEDHVPAVYKKVMRTEERIQNDFPAVAFAFHVRASQGRTPSSTAPLFARPLFER
jgi:hypothetical protein